MKILTGNSNKPLAEAIAAKLALPLVKANIRRFSDNEIFVEILENVRGEDVFVIQSTSYPANDHLMELLITIDALRRSSARRITAVMPYYGYARQDRKTAVAHADLGQAGRQPDHPCRRQPRADARPACRARSRASSTSRSTTSMPARCSPSDIKETLSNRNLTVVSPDTGGVVRARAIAKRVDADLAIIDKRRERGGRQRGHERDRRRQGSRLHPDRRHRRFGRHAVQRRRRADGPGRQVGVRPMSRTACCRAARWPASPPRRSRRW